MISSVPNHGERIDIDGRASLQLSTFLNDVAGIYGLVNQPTEDELIFVDGKAELGLVTFLQDAAVLANLTEPSEGEIIIEDGIASGVFQDFLDQLAV